MNKIKQWWNNASRSKKITITIIVVIVVIIIILLVKKKPSQALSTTVQTGTVIDNVVLSGTTDSASAVNLGFASQGRIASVSVKEGDNVHAGQVIASLDTAALQASLKNAQAALVIAQANASNSATNLATVTAQQNTLVQNADNNLLSDHLEADPTNLATTAAAPTISGTYTGPQGTYTIHVYPSGTVTGASFSISGLETGFTEPAATTTPVPLGSRGLYIQFQPGVSYGNATWTVTIPNTQSSTYTADLNAYNAAVATRTQAIAAAADSANATSTAGSISAAQISQAQAQVDSVIAQIQQSEIIAPFDGVIASVDVKPGQTTNSFNPSGNSTDSANANISLISESDYEVTLKTPEIDVTSIAVGQIVSISLDAFNSDTVFAGTIASIDPAETIVDGVPVYETKVVFTQLDPRIRSGMTATATINVGEKDNVLTVPVAFVHSDTNGEYVYVLNGKHTVKTIVTTGLRGSDSTYEITSGLTAGQTVLSDAQ
jgi:HlyD family secretion protein